MGYWVTGLLGYWVWVSDGSCGGCVWVWVWGGEGAMKGRRREILAGGPQSVGNRLGPYIPKRIDTFIGGHMVFCHGSNHLYAGFGSTQFMIFNRQP